MIQISTDEKRLAAIIRNAVSDALAISPTSSSDPHGDWEYIPSIHRLAELTGCPYSTTKSLVNAGRIKYTRTANSVKFYVPDVLFAIESDPVVAKHFKTWNPISSAKPVVPPVPPKIYVETELYQKKFIYATVKYQGWRCFICIQDCLWNDANKVADFINQVILHRHEKYPFRIPPVINNP